MKRTKHIQYTQSEIFSTTCVFVTVKIKKSTPFFILYDLNMCMCFKLNE